MSRWRVVGCMASFEGNRPALLSNQTCVWDGANWNQRSPGSSPSARSTDALAHSVARGPFVICGPAAAPARPHGRLRRIFFSSPVEREYSSSGVKDVQ